MNNIRAAYRKNAVQLEGMYIRARTTGRKVNGFTAEYLGAKAAECRRLSHASDDELRTHFARARQIVAARLAELQGA